MAGDVDRQRFLHRPGRDVGLRDLVVFAVVAEEILRKSTVEDVAELFGHLTEEANHDGGARFFA
jgi:hypothetical protein